MIEKITIKNIATFDSTGVVIENIKKLNFFFGHNGSGKSTIAKFLRDISTTDPNGENIDYQYCTQEGCDPTNDDILVFDEQFIEDNFHKRKNFKGVFSLDETNQTISDAITGKEIELKQVETIKSSRNDLINKIGTLYSSKNMELTNLCFEERRVFESMSKIPLKYSRNKADNLNYIRNIISENTNATTFDSIRDRYVTFYEKEIIEVGTNIDSCKYKRIRQLEEKINNLFSQVIVGNEDVDIASLINELNNRSWVEQGISFISDGSEKCPFCQNDTINKDLKSQFEKYFDVAYKEKIEQIKAFQITYNTLVGEFQQEVKNIQDVYNPSNALSNLYISIGELLSSNNNLFLDKLQSPNHKLALAKLSSLKENMSLIIKSINDNNMDFQELDANRTKLLSDIWRYMAQKCVNKVKEFDTWTQKSNSTIESIKSSINNLQAKNMLIKEEIEVLRGQTSNTTQAVENINSILKHSGFAGFEIKEKEKVNNISLYYLSRNGNDNPDKNIFKTLSEGEKNFIAFLYFYQLCLGTDDIDNKKDKNKIIVIDDPVSSLDNQSLFIVSSLIHQLIRQKDKTKAGKQEFLHQNIKQVFIFTHNLYFYKEIAFERRPTCTDFWNHQISKINNKTSIIGERNKTITDDYSLLWNTLHELSKNIPADKSQNIMIANLMRRTIDSYVNFLGIGKDCWSAIMEDTDDPMYYIKSAFIGAINDESHGVTPFDSLHYHKITIEQPQILFDVFKSIFENIGVEHYNMMMNITTDEQA